MERLEPGNALQTNVSSMFFTSMNENHGQPDGCGFTQPVNAPTAKYADASEANIVTPKHKAKAR